MASKNVGKEQNVKFLEYVQIQVATNWKYAVK